MEDNLTNLNINPKADSNKQVLTNNLPDINQVQSEKIGLKLWKKTLVLHIVWSVVFFIIGVITYFVVKNTEQFALYFLIVGIFYLLFCILTGYTKYLSWESMRYSLRENDISFEKGWFWNRKVVVPFNRIQHITVVETAIDRIFNIAQLNIFTAGGQNSDLNIQGLDPDVALRIRDFVLRKTTVEDEEE